MGRRDGGREGKRRSEEEENFFSEFFLSAKNHPPRWPAQQLAAAATILLALATFEAEPWKGRKGSREGGAEMSLHSYDSKSEPWSLTTCLFLVNQSCQKESRICSIFCCANVDLGMLNKRDQLGGRCPC